MSAETTYCVNHPKIETLVRCSKCEKPICSKCRVETPVGFRCRDCGIYRPVQYQVAWYLYLAAVPVGLIAGLFGGTIGPRFGFLNFFIGSIIGSLVGQAISRVTKGKRGPTLAAIAGASIVLGALLSPVVVERSLLHLAAQVINPWVWFYLLFAAPAAFWRLR